MGFTDDGNSADVRGEEGTQFTNAPLLVHPHFGDKHAGAHHQMFVDRARETHQIVKARGRGNRVVRLAHQLRHIPLGGGFAIGAGDGHHCWPHTLQFSFSLADKFLREPALDPPQHTQGKIGEVRSQDQGHHHTGGSKNSHSKGAHHDLKAEQAPVGTACPSCPGQRACHTAKRQPPRGEQ